MSDDEKVFTYGGSEAEVDWDGRLCIHVGECGRASNELFVGGRQPWCQPDEVPPDEALDVVKRCPTGAITLRLKDGSAPETADDENSVTVSNNGPLYVRGDLAIDGAADDMPGVKFRAALCRCGLSKRKPFCDNSHEGEFKDHGAVGETGDGLDATGGTLTVGRAKNGPLLLAGNLVIRNGAGRVAWKGTKCALCRCGQSKNKPFCDGSHKAAGFTAD
ncbi:MAG: CDGSH iron-sulfur domain-containing protein [Deltaproteobacteria bacterium]|nr:CDGSH iron-sulfur domain-containing protein [Deltaproteobacteria bacterium]